MKEKKDVMIHGDYAAFWGSIFSNWAPSRFRAYGKVWETAEQCFMWLKAKYFKDEDIAMKITKAINPSDAKKLGRMVKGFDQEKWDAVCYEKMYEAVYKKFDQNEDLLKELLSEKYKGKHFVEGSPQDRIWGVGIIWTDEAIADKDNWQGTNYLGRVLDDVREAFLKELA